MKFVDDLADDDDIVELLAMTMSDVLFFSRVRCSARSCQRRRKVTRIVQKVNLKAWLGSATVYVEKLESVRDFKSWPFVCTCDAS